MIPDIEEKLKGIVSDRLETMFGDAWLIKGLPKQVYTRLRNQANDEVYRLTQEGMDDADVSPWDFVTLPDCKEIVISGKNWSSSFSELLVMPQEKNLPGDKSAKTDWIVRLNSIKKKLSQKSYSVSLDEFNFVSNVYNWISDILLI